ncbi:MAG: P-protein (PheA) [Planctomycetaceae bacterium TMED240]|nr:prephenate dehydratase [Rhodopirellula sp.]OUX05331.1 MAG: P-protein (PheA) [Planctomycetaceae bacterium TMED240]
MNSSSSNDSTTQPSSDRAVKTSEVIDSIDQRILELVRQRHKAVQQMCAEQQGAPVGRISEAAARIDRLLDRSAQAEESHEDGAVPNASSAALLRHVSSICLQSVHRLQAIYLGPPHSYSHLAAIKYFGDATTLTPVASIPAVFEAVAREDALCGIVPIENSTDGRVVDTLGMFVRGDMQICGEVLLPIHHNLLSTTPRDQITEVHSKPQALSQCRGWLAKQLPNAQLVEISSTAAAAKLASQQRGVAAVASLEAGREYELDVIANSIEDNPNNVTRFAVLGRERPAPTSNDKTAILFQVSHEPGALANAMTIFKQQDLNLTWIESFPAPETKNEYMFFIELTGHRETEAVQSAIQELDSLAQRLTILGSYPRACIE